MENLTEIRQHAALLKTAFDPYFPAPAQAWEDFARHCEHVSVPANHLLKAQHTREKYFYFIIRGCIGVFLWKGNQFVCLDFGFENHFFGDYMSILTKAITPLQVMSLEPCALLRIRADRYLELGQTDIGNTLMRAAAESTFIQKQQQQIDLLTKTAEQRYHELVSTNPQILQRIPQKHLASWLGITPQSLSRIRNRR